MPPAGDGPVLAAFRKSLRKEVLSVPVVPEMNLQGCAFEMVQVDDVDQLIGGQFFGGTFALQEFVSENPGRKGHRIPATGFCRVFLRGMIDLGLDHGFQWLLMKSGSSEKNICKGCSSITGIHKVVSQYNISARNASRNKGKMKGSVLDPDEIWRCSHRPLRERIRSDKRQLEVMV